MNYIYNETEEYPITERQIKAKYPNTLFPSPFKAEGYSVVFSIPKPDFTDLQRITEGEPIFTSKNVWEQIWVITNKFQDDPDGLTQVEQETTYLAGVQENAITAKLKELKADFETYVFSYYGYVTQMTILKASTDVSTNAVTKARAKEVGDWITLAQTEYLTKKTSIAGGNLDTAWNFSTFDDIKPEWDFENFVLGV